MLRSIGKIEITFLYWLAYASSRLPIIQRLASALDLFQNIDGFRDPYERFGLVIVLIDVGADQGHEIVKVSQKSR
jgi:hypothetical protein